VLSNIAAKIAEDEEEESGVARRQRAERVRSLTEAPPPLPDFSRFHDRFRPDPSSPTPEGDMRAAFFLGYEGANCEFLRLDGALQRAVASGREVVSASFVTPYPPGFPVLVPGQVISPQIVEYLGAVDVKEIHGYKPGYGLRVFTEAALAAPAQATGAANAARAGARSVST
jgi:arginine decarboxylase